MLVKYDYIIVGAINIFAGVLLLSSAVLDKFVCKMTEPGKVDLHNYEKVALRSYSDLPENKKEAVEKKEIKNISTSSSHSAYTVVWSGVIPIITWKTAIEKLTEFPIFT